MSYDSLAQQMYDAAIIENLNKLRHYIMGRETWEAAEYEIEAFNNSFADVDEEQLSSIIVSRMLFISCDKNNLAFEFCNVLNSYLSSTYSSDSSRQEAYGKFRDAAQDMYLSKREFNELTQDHKSLLLDFLRSSIYSLAAKEVSYEFELPTDGMGL